MLPLVKRKAVSSELEGEGLRVRREPGRGDFRLTNPRDTLQEREASGDRSVYITTVSQIVKGNLVKQRTVSENESARVRYMS